ncbi:MAG: universal stress protein [Deltaproteobacteria bacterium]|nr:universal stress protein [Deltaproteobacteria bacterium]
MITYPFRHILVPTDFSSCSDAALELAAHLAHDHHATLELVHVVDVADLPLDAMIHPPSHPSGISIADHTKALAERELADRLSRLPVPVELRKSTTAYGSPHRAILEHAKAAAVDLIVMGTHGRTGLAHLLVGSVAEKLIRHSPIPVLTIREHAAAPAD